MFDKKAVLGFYAPCHGVEKILTSRISCLTLAKLFRRQILDVPIFDNEKQNIGFFDIYEQKFEDIGEADNGLRLQTL